MAKREKKPVHKVVMTEGKRNIIQQLLQEYDIETAEDIQDALTETAISLRWLTAAMGRSELRFLRIASLLSSLRLLKSVRKTFQTLTRRSYPCMQKE